MDDAPMARDQERVSERAHYGNVGDFGDSAQLCILNMNPHAACSHNFKNILIGRTGFGPTPPIITVFPRFLSDIRTRKSDRMIPF